MSLKRKRGSDPQMFEYDSHPSTSSMSNTDAAKNHQPVSVGEGNEVPTRKRRRTDSFVKLPSLLYSDWSGSSDQIAGSEDPPQASVCAIEDHGHQEPRPSGPEALPDQPVQTPRLHEWSKSVSEGSDSQAYSPVELRSLHWSSSSSQSQTEEDQATAALSERQAEDETGRTSFITGRKRKRSAQVCDRHQSTSSTSSSDVSENHQPVSVGEEEEMPMRKRRKTDSSESLPSLNFWESSSSTVDQGSTAIYDTEDESSLPGGLEVLPPVRPAPAPAHSNRVDPTQDNILSRYEIGRMLGEGSYGSVFEGKRLEDGLEVAVKITIKPRNMKYIYVAGHPARLPLEVGLLILANKGPKVPEIIELLDWQEQPDRYIMILERPSPCKDLFDFLNSHDGTLNEDMARYIMAQTTMAALMCCRRGVFHRDIKLENLLINTETLEVKLIDFGCGALLQESGYKTFCGTLRYCPPEYHAEGNYHGEPTTVWSLGVLLFLLVCGRYPKRRDRRLINNNIWSMPGLSNECRHLIRSLLQESPRQRIDLRDILQHEWFN